MSGSGVSASKPASAGERLRLGLQDFADLGGEVGEAALDGLVALLGARRGFARRRQGFERGACGAVGLGERVFALRRGDRPRLAPRALPRSRSRRSGRGALPRTAAAYRPGFRARSWSRRAAPRWSRSAVAAPSRRAVQAAASAAIAASRRSRKLDLAGERLGLGAHFGEPAAIVRRPWCGSRRGALRDRRSAAGPRAPARLARALRSASASAVASRACASASAERREVMRLSSRSAAAWRSRAASASCCRSRQRVRAAFSASRVAATSASAAVTACAAHIEVGAHDAQLRLDVGEPVAAGEATGRAGRRMGRDRKAVPAPQVAVLRHQPLAGLESRARRAPSCARHHADLREPAHHGVGRRGDEAGRAAARLRAAPDRSDRPARRPNASARSARPARRDRRRARRRARSRSPSRP